MANILDEAPAFLSARLGDYARDFPAAQKLVYHGQYSAREEETADPADEAQAREQAAALLRCEPEELEIAARFEDQGRLLLAHDGKTVTVTAAGVEQLRDSRLVSESLISDDEARTAAEEVLRALGYEGLVWEESARRGNLLELRGSAETDGVTGLDHEIAVTVALDDGSIYALDLSRAAGEGAASDWLFPEEEAKALVPTGLHLRSVRRVSLAGADGQSMACYELSCLEDSGRSVRIYLNADTGGQEEILIG